MDGFAAKTTKIPEKSTTLICKEWQVEFDDAPFEQFEVRCNKVMKKASKRRARSAQEKQFLEHDRLLHPRKSHNERGEPVFDMDERAKESLQCDIKNNLHKRMKPRELQEFHFDVHGKHPLHIFGSRIYQMMRRQKFPNCLEHESTEKRGKCAKDNGTFERN